MNFKATTQAVKNVFRWYFTTIRTDLVLLEDRLVPAIARSTRGKEWLLAIPMFGSLISFVWLIVEQVARMPAKEPALRGVFEGVGIMGLILCAVCYIFFFITVCAYADEHRYS